MDLEFWSGLLLVLAVFATLGYLAKEFFFDRGKGISRKSLRKAIAEQRQRGEAKPVNEHLIGATGEVVSVSEDDERPMKVRLGFELWPARTDSSGDSRFPVGTSIEVTAVHEPIVIVRHADTPAGDSGDESTRRR